MDSTKLMDAIACDTFRATQSFSRKATFRVLRYSRTFRPIITLRWYQASRGIKRRLFRKLHSIACQRGGMDFSPDATIGAGLAIFHGWGIVVSGGANIGRNVTIMQGVTIGQADRISRDGTRTTGFPTISDNVWIGPNAVIVGGVTIGAGARILAGAVVTGDIPAAALVGGNPATILREGIAEDVLNKVPFGS